MATRTGKKTHDWRPAFLEALARSGNISYSAKLTDIHRNTAMHARKSEPEFKAQMESALEEAADTLELEAWRRAHDGIEKVITVAGKREVVKQYSDTLLIFLLKAIRPDKYRERVNHHHKGDEYRIAGGTREERRKEVMDNLMKLANVQATQRLRETPIT